jgi:hypothetical protein
MADAVLFAEAEASTSEVVVSKNKKHRKDKRGCGLHPARRSV